MATKQKKEYTDVQVIREGTQITLPEGMTYDEGVTWLQRRRDEEEKVVNVRATIDAYPFDAAHALMLVMKEKYGWTDFRGGVLIDVEVAFGKTAQVPWGEFSIPGVDGAFATAPDFKTSGHVGFTLQGRVRRKHEAEFTELARLVREKLKTHSIYRGKAVRVAFPTDIEELNSPENRPRFMDTSSVKPEELVFSEDVAKAVQTSIFTPVEKTAQCRQFGIPLKRGILLEGPYGTGKTLTATKASWVCEQNGWTFLYIDSVKNLEQAIALASQYQPAMIFAEDIDRVMEGERTEDMDAILNTIDGIESKGTETIVVLTTNHVEDINQAMLRPGRLDAVISVKPPDGVAVQKLLHLFARGLLKEGEDLAKVGWALAGQIPAVLREVVERAKLAALTRLNAGETLYLTAEDLQEAADGMLAHLELLKPRPEDNRTQIERFGDVVGRALTSGITAATLKYGDLPSQEAPSNPRS